MPARWLCRIGGMHPGATEIVLPREAAEQGYVR